MTEIFVQVLVTFKATGDYYKHSLHIGESSIICGGNITLNDYVESSFKLEYPDRSKVDIEINSIKDIGENCSWARYMTLEMLAKHIRGVRCVGISFDAVRVGSTSPGESKPEVQVVLERDNLTYKKEKTLKKTYDKVVEEKPRRKVSLWVYFWIVSAIMLVVSYLFDKVLI